MEYGGEWIGLLFLSSPRRTVDLRDVCMMRGIGTGIDGVKETGCLIVCLNLDCLLMSRVAARGSTSSGVRGGMILLGNSRLGGDGGYP